MGSLRTVRFAAAIAFCLASSTLLAQTFTAGERLVQDGFENLRMSTSVWLQLSGTETIGGRGNSIYIDTFWYQTYDASGQPLAKLECMETRDGFAMYRIVGDGTTLWWYDMVKREYSSQNYGSITAPPQPPSYLQTLLQGFGTFSKSQAVHPARLLREVYAGSFALYRPWILGAKEQIVQGMASFDDPVLGTKRTYVANPTRTYVVFWNGNPATRSIAFQLDQSANSVWELRGVFYADVSLVGSANKLVEWTTSIRKVQPSVANFVFVPPTQARPVVKQGGGSY